MCYLSVITKENSHWIFLNFIMWVGHNQWNKFENFNYLNVAFISYKLTIWDLNANSGGRRTPTNDQEKWTFGFG